MPSFRIEGKDPRTGKDRLVKIPDQPATESHTCGLCEDSGYIVESGQGIYCSCAKGASMKSADLHLPKPKISMPPTPDDNDRSAFDQNKNLGTQLDLFD